MRRLLAVGATRAAQAPAQHQSRALTCAAARGVLSRGGALTHRDVLSSRRGTAPVRATRFSSTADADLAGVLASEIKGEVEADPGAALQELLDSMTSTAVTKIDHVRAASR